MKPLGGPILAALVLGLCAGCNEQGPDYVSPVRFDSASIWLRSAQGDSAPLLVEIADDEAKRAFGLMARPELDPESGMVFLFDSVQGGDRGYWMFRTKMPLDIAFMDSTGAIGKILSMTPCESDLYASACPAYAPGVDYWAALEVGQGWFGKHGIAEGDSARLAAARAVP